MFLFVRNLNDWAFNVTNVSSMTAAELLLNGTDEDSFSGYTVESEGDIAAFGITGPEMTKLYNEATGESLVKLGTKTVAARRLFSVLERVAGTEASFTLPGKAKGKFKVKAETLPDTPTITRVTRKSKGVNLEPKEKAVPVREGTKQHKLLEALVDGTTLAQLLVLLSPWSAASIKSGLYHDVNTLKGYGVSTTDDDDGVQVYRLVYPEGVTEILVSVKKEK